jgi:hypothetical protein
MDVKSNGVANSVVWDATGAISAGGNYLFEIKYSGAQIQLSVDNIVRATIIMVINFTTIFTTINAGCDTTAFQADAVFLAP